MIDSDFKMIFNFMCRILLLKSKTTAVIFEGIKWILLGFFVMFFYLSSAVQATGDMGNQPSTGFIENPASGSEIFEICADAACTNHTTVFSTGQTVYLRINSTIVSDATGKNQLKVCYYNGTCPVSQGNWIVSGTGPYVFTNNFTAPNSADWYYLDAAITDSGGDKFKAGDAIKVGTATTEHYIRFYVDENFTILSTTHFSSNAIYYQIYGSGDTYDASQTLPRIRDFQDNSDSTLTETCVQAGSVYNCSIDLSTLDGISFRNAEWYTLDPKMKDATGVKIFDNTITMFVVYNNSLYDSRDTSPPSSNGIWYINDSDTITVNGSGWGASQEINVSINDSGVPSSQVGYWVLTADSNGNFTTEATYTLASGDPTGTWTIYVSSDGGSTWLQYDTFTVATSNVPEFPVGSTIVFLSAAAIYGLMQKSFQREKSGQT